MPRIGDALLKKQEADGFITVPEASKRTAVAERSIRTWTRTGRLKVRRIGGLVFVEIKSLNEAVGITS